MSTHAPVYIDDLFGALEVPSGGREWIVVRTKPRCEKKLAGYARQNGIGYYLPQTECTRVYQRRKVLSRQPLFRGYLFCTVDSKGRETLNMTGLTSSFIKIDHQKSFVEELKNVYVSLRGQMVSTARNWIDAGYKVEIVNGPMRGMLGVVDRHDRLNEVQVQISILHQHLTVKVNPSDVRVLEDYGERADII